MTTGITFYTNGSSSISLPKIIHTEKLCDVFAGKWAPTEGDQTTARLLSDMVQIRDKQEESVDGALLAVVAGVAIGCAASLVGKRRYESTKVIAADI